MSFLRSGDTVTLPVGRGMERRKYRARVTADWKLLCNGQVFKSVTAFSNTVTTQHWNDGVVHTGQGSRCYVRRDGRRITLKKLAAIAYHREGVAFHQAALVALDA